MIKAELVPERMVRVSELHESRGWEPIFEFNVVQLPEVTAELFKALTPVEKQLFRDYI